LGYASVIHLVSFKAPQQLFFNDTIELTEAARQIPLVQEEMNSRPVTGSWLERNGAARCVILESGIWLLVAPRNR
jgi:hypothetical protein